MSFGQAVLCACSIALSLCSPVFLVAQVRAVAPLYPPLVTSTDGINADGGVSVELLRSAATRAGLALQVEVQPLARALVTASSTKDVLIFPLLRTKDRDSDFEWLGPVNRVDYRLYQRKGAGEASLGSVHKLGNRVVGVLINDVISQYLKANQVTGIQESSTLSSLISMLLSGRIDYMATTPASMASELSSRGLPVDTVESVLTLEGYTNGPYSYAAVAKGSNPRLIQGLKTAFADMQKDGTWSGIFQKY